MSSGPINPNARPGAPIPDSKETGAGNILSNVVVNPVARVDAAFDRMVEDGLRRFAPRIAAGFDAHAPLPPKANLKRPVVMFTGLFMNADSYDPMAKQFGGQSYAVYNMKDHKFHLRGSNGSVLSDRELKNMKAFIIQFADPEAPPDAHVPEINEALAQVARVTQTDASSPVTVDAVVHSAGGKAFQDYLRYRVDSGDRVVDIGKLVGVGSVPEGTAVGNVGAVISAFTGDVFGFGQAAKDLAFGAEYLRELNARLPAEMSEVKEGSTIVAVTGAPTLDSDGKLVSGDGFTTPEDAKKMGGVKVVTLRSFDATLLNHLAETRFTGVIGAVQKELTGQS